MGNNHRGTLIVPDHGVDDLEKDVNVLLVQYKSDLRRPFSIKAAYRNNRQHLPIWTAAKTGSQTQADQPHTFCTDCRVLCNTIGYCRDIRSFPDWQSNDSC